MNKAAEAVWCVKQEVAPQLGLQFLLPRLPETSCANAFLKFPDGTVRVQAGKHLERAAPQRVPMFACNRGRCLPSRGPTCGRPSKGART